MKKSIKIFLTAILSVMLLFTCAQPVVFADDVSPITSSITKDKISDTSGATTIASNIVSWIWIISIIVAVVVLMYTGLKFIVGSTQEKAEYKKTMIPYLVGAILIFGASAITKVVVGLAQGITK